MDPRLSIVASLLLSSAIGAIACSPSCAQGLGKPDAPIPKSVDAVDTVKVISAQAPYEYITPKQRVQWAMTETFGPESLLVGGWSAGIGTARDHPPEYGPHWEGFAKRYGIRFSGVATSNAMEAGLGALWGEDPRYVRNPLLPFKRRIDNVFLFSLMARNRHGQLMPAYARYIAIPGNNFLSNTWRVRYCRGYLRQRLERILAGREAQVLQPLRARQARPHRFTAIACSSKCPPRSSEPAPMKARAGISFVKYDL